MTTVRERIEKIFSEQCLHLTDSEIGYGGPVAMVARRLEAVLRYIEEREAQVETIHSLRAERDDARNKLELTENEHMNCGGAIHVLKVERDEAVKRAADHVKRVAELCAERDKYLGECAQLYEAFRPQSIANPREARQHIENLREGAGREGERETARLIRELSVERDDAVKRAEETIKRAEQACLEALREKAHATKRAEAAESQISVYAAQTDGALAGQVEYVKRAQAAEGQLAAAISDRYLAQQGVRELTSKLTDLQSLVESLKNERDAARARCERILVSYPDDD